MVKDEVHAKFLSNFYDTHKALGSETRAFETEVPYNYFGDRGIIDFVDYWINRTYNLSDLSDLEPSNPGLLDFLQLYELKTELLDIGETIRQVKKAKLFFAKGFEGNIDHLKFNPAPEHKLIVRSSLVILKTEKNISDLQKYCTSFESANIDGVFFFDLKESKLLRRTLEVL
jgi:hypothetical protein